ncbi:hypothetical protein P692DRAFT_20867215 [Suillus brevipes Sb2]|nr:hypothetical protein P692DRAFT_20867215 [Suillus brevipes Sb2]
MVFSRASTTASVLSDKLAQIASYSAAVAVDNEEHDREYNVILKDVSKDAKKRGPLTLGGNIMRGGVDLADAMKAFDFALVGTSLPSSTCTFLGVQVLLLACHISKELS